MNDFDFSMPMNDEEYSRLAPHERELVRMRMMRSAAAEVMGALAEVMGYLDRLNSKVEELAGRSGSLDVAGKTSQELLHLYEWEKLHDPRLTKKEFALRRNIPVNRLYMASKRRKRG